MKVAILGYGEQGGAAYDYWGPDNVITICDQATVADVPTGARLNCGSQYLANLDQFELIIRSPSVHPRDIVAANSPAILSKVTSVTNEFLRVCPTKNVIGVTGTKGKGTTSTLIAKMLEAAGKRVHLGGNIGIPPLNLLKSDIQPDDYVVLELANFQLIDLQYSPHIAICLMVVPEHLNWHTDFAEYVAAKSQLFAHQTADNIAIYFVGSEVSKAVAGAGQGRQLPYFAPPGAYVADDMIRMGDNDVCNTSELKLLGKHNWQNICAAVTAVWQVTQDVQAIRSVLVSFSGLEHRLELVREVDGVRYYDDSFGTTPETATVAIEAFQQPKVVILGGSDKGASYGELAETMRHANVRAAIVIGATGPAIKAALEKAGVSNLLDGGSGMPAIVQAARGCARPGDVVLLSTACASFDMFKNYKDRGEQFQAAVNILP